MEISQQAILIAGATLFVLLLIVVLIIRHLLKRISDLTDQSLYFRRASEKQDRLVRLLEEVLADRVGKPAK
ncbi:MAG: hypothetical protein V1883_00760 [Candidatus Omnitrophota bacterium]